jgi:hypothetical protein
MKSPAMMNSQTPTDSSIEGIAPACDSSQNNVSYTSLTSLPIAAYLHAVLLKKMYRGNVNLTQENHYFIVQIGKNKRSQWTKLPRR